MSRSYAKRILAGRNEGMDGTGIITHDPNDRTGLYDRRAKLFAEQKGLCFWCSLPMLLNCSRTGVLFATLDHLDRRGTTNGKPRRCVLAHGACNHARGHGPASSRAAQRVEKALKMAKHLIQTP